MSSSDSTIEETRAENSVDRRNALGMLGRMAVRVTSGPFWQGVGALVFGIPEKRQGEVFSGVGFYSRPAPGVNAEAIFGYPYGPENPVIIATRDEDTRKRVAKINQDETIAYNTVAALLVDKDGHIHAKLHNGTTKRLAFADDLNNLRGFVKQQFFGAGHVHQVTGAATTATTPVVVPVPLPATDYDGTDVLRGQ